MMEVGEETRQECNSMKENLMCPDHAGNPNAQVVLKFKKNITLIQT